MKTALTIKAIAKIWLIAVSAFWGLMLIGYAIEGDPYAVEGSEREGIILGILMIYAIGSTLYTFKNEKTGSQLLIASGIFLSIFAAITAGRNQLFAIAVSGGAFLIPGIIIYLANYYSRKNETPKNNFRW